MIGGLDFDHSINLSPPRVLTFWYPCTHLRNFKVVCSRCQAPNVTSCFIQFSEIETLIIIMIFFNAGLSCVNASSQFSKFNPYLKINDCLSISINIENDIFDIWVIIHDSVARFDSSVDPDSYRNNLYWYRPMS